VLLCRLGGSRAERDSHSLALFGVTHGAGAFGLELLWLGFFLRLHALSLYVSSGILAMSPPDVHVFVVYFSGNEQV
jgi:apolipoprotein N-acyltransferase